MISICKNLPDLDILSAELVKINCLFEAYKNDDKVLFWCQDTDKALISMTDGNMVIFNNGADIEELKEFVGILSPVCIFSDFETLKKLDQEPQERINIMYRFADEAEEFQGDELKSDELYRLLDVDGLSLPAYPYFAVDYCRRLNMSTADYFALKEKCAAISFNCKNMAIMNGIASHQKGYGAIAVKAILHKNRGRHFFVCCRDSVKGFYEKLGFEFMYFGGYKINKEKGI